MIALQQRPKLTLLTLVTYSPILFAFLLVVVVFVLWVSSTLVNSAVDLQNKFVPIRDNAYVYEQFKLIRSYFLWYLWLYFAIGESLYLFVFFSRIFQLLLLKNSDWKEPLRKMVKLFGYFCLAFIIFAFSLVINTIVISAIGFIVQFSISAV